MPAKVKNSEPFRRLLLKFTGPGTQALSDRAWDNLHLMKALPLHFMNPAQLDCKRHTGKPQRWSGETSLLLWSSLFCNSWVQNHLSNVLFKGKYILLLLTMILWQWSIKWNVILFNMQFNNLTAHTQFVKFSLMGCKGIIFWVVWGNTVFLPLTYWSAGHRVQQVLSLRQVFTYKIISVVYTIQRGRHIQIWYGLMEVVL